MSRVYVVKSDNAKVGVRARLIRAGTKNQALRFVAASLFTCDIASQEALIEGLGAGISIEDATAEEVES